MQLIKKCFGLCNHILYGEPKLLEAVAAGGGSAEAVHGDAVAIQADETVPAEGLSGFHHHALAHSVGEHFLLVGIGLLVEQLDAGHRDHAHLLAFSGELFGGLDAEIKLGAGAGAGADQDQIRGASTVLEHVPTQGHLVDRGVCLVGHALAAETEGAGALAVLDGHLVSTAGLVAIARTEHQHVRHRLQ